MMVPIYVLLCCCHYNTMTMMTSCVVVVEFQPFELLPPGFRVLKVRNCDNLGSHLDLGNSRTLLFVLTPLYLPLCLDVSLS
eukprot:scaffold143_cov109-Skeletonema_marinoi.AAC.1